MRHPPQRIFLFFAIIWGTLTVFLTPPFQVCDEQMHFMRIYHLSTGHFFPSFHKNILGGFLPESITRVDSIFGEVSFHPERKAGADKFAAAFNTPLESEHVIFTFFPNTAHYFPVPYLPQVLSITLPRLLNVPPVFLLYAGRIGNLFFWTLLMYMAIAITPAGKWVFTLLALLPMSVFQAASVSHDAMTNGMSFLLIALVFRLAFDPGKVIKWQDLFWVTLLSVLLAVSKSTYFFLTLLVLMIPAVKFTSNRKHILTLLMIFSVTAMAVMLGSLYIRTVYGGNSLSHDMQIVFSSEGREVHPYMQLSFILAHKATYLNTIFHTFWIQKAFIAESFIGLLGWLDTKLPTWYILTAYAMLLIAALTSANETARLKPTAKLIMILCQCGVVFVMCTMLYMSWTPVGMDEIKGIKQGRLYIAISPLFLMLFSNGYFKLPGRFISKVSILFIMTSMMVMSYSLLSRYYWSNAL